MVFLKSAYSQPEVSIFLDYRESPRSIEISAIWTKALIGNADFSINTYDPNSILEFGFNNTNLLEDGTESWAQDIVFSDNW